MSKITKAKYLHITNTLRNETNIRHFKLQFSNIQLLFALPQGTIRYFVASPQSLIASSMVKS